MAARFVYTLRQAANNAPKLGLGSSRNAHSSAPSNDTSDVNMRRAFMVFIGGIATYTASQLVLEGKEGSHLGVSLQRGMNKEETHRLEGASNTPTGQADPTAAGSAAKSPRRLTWWRVAHVKDGAQGSSSPSPTADPWGASGLRGPAAGSLRAGGQVI